jgi:hypothetical protein
MVMMINGAPCDELTDDLVALFYKIMKAAGTAPSSVDSLTCPTA